MADSGLRRWNRFEWDFSAAIRFVCGEGAPVFTPQKNQKNTQLARPPAGLAADTTLVMTSFRQLNAPMEGDKFGRAVEALRRATLKEPRTAGAVCHVAGLQLRVGDRAGARATIEAARERFPESWVVWKFDGLIHLEERGRERAQALESATLCFRRAAELANSLANRAELLLQVGTCLGHCGKPEEELAVYGQVMEIMPHHALAYLYWVQSQPGLDVHDPIAGTIAKLIESAEVDRFDKRFLHYALGHLCDRSGDWAAAFGHFRQANDLRACVTQRTDLDAIGRAAEARVALYGHDRIEQFSRYGERTIAPIFVVGMPRSGTSLVEQILSSHSQVVGIGEGVELFRAAQRMPSFLSEPADLPLVHGRVDGGSRAGACRADLAGVREFGRSGRTGRHQDARGFLGSRI